MTQPTPTTPPSTAAAPSVAWLVEQARLPKDAVPLAASAADGGALVEALTAKGKTTEAVKVIAAALPPREGVWWAWVSARHAAQLGPSGGSPEPVGSIAAWPPD